MKIEKMERRVPIEVVKFDGTRDQGREIVRWLNETHGHYAVMRETFKPGRPEDDGTTTEYEEILSIDVGRGSGVKIGDAVVLDDGQLLVMSETAFSEYCAERAVRTLLTPILFKEYTQKQGGSVYFARLAEVTHGNLALAHEITGDNIQVGDYVNWWLDGFHRVSKREFASSFSCPTVSTIDQPDFNG